MTESIKILMAEDSDLDAELVLHELKRSGLSFEKLRVQTEPDFRRALDEFRPHIVLCDFSMPGFGGIAALRIFREAGIDIPFIFVSGTIGEEVAVEAMKNGADDYLLKDRLSRLGAALTQALERKRLRDEARKSAVALREREAGLRQAQQIAKLAHAVSGPDGSFESRSETLPALIAVDPARVPKSTREWLTLLHPDDRATFRSKSIEAGENRTRVDIEYRLQRGDGAWIHIRHLMEPLQGDADAAGGTRWFNTVQDITEQKRAEYELQRFRAAMDVSVDSIYLTDPATMRFVYLNNTACQRLGYSREQLLQMGPQDVFHLDREQIGREFDDVIAAGDRGIRYERTFLRSDGSEGWTEIHRHGLRTEGGTLIVTIGRDISGRKRAEARIARLFSLKDALSRMNHAIVHSKSDQPLFDEICAILVERAGLHYAGIGITEPESGEFRWVAGAGAGVAALAQARRTVRADQPEGRGPSGTAVRERRHVVCQDFLADPSTAPWHDIGRTLGIGSTATFPIMRAGAAVGVITVYSRAEQAFDDEVVALLDEAARDVSFALDNFDRESQRKQSEEALRASERRVKRLNRVHAVLSGINALIVRAQTREELFLETCRIAVEAGRFRTAWVGTVDRDTHEVRVAARSGADLGALDRVRRSSREDRPGGRGMIGLALRERAPQVVNDTATDERMAYREQALECGFRSLVVLPLVADGEAVGVLSLMSEEPAFFDDAEMKLLTELAGDISFALEHIKKKEQLDYLVFYDSLTGLANRALFGDRLNQLAHAAGQAGSGFAVAILDIERLRTINDSLGRQAGDALIKLAAERLKTIGGPKRAGRISADHFALVLGAVRGRSEADRIVNDALRKCFGEPFQVNGTELRISAKAGVALFPGDGADAETLLGKAEAALRKAKELGERHVFYTPDLTEQTARTLTLENKLRQALEKDEFVLHYQPKVDLEARRIVGVEALIRWQSPEMGLVPPGKFIPLMEETGLILPVGTWALQRASLDHRRWTEQKLEPPRVAVNVSPIQLRQRDFVAVIEQAIIEGVAPTGIDLEITESLVMEDVQGNIEKLKAVRQLGVQIAIDDFGTGYSSLGYLAKLPVQLLKIDRSFIITMLNDADTMTLVSTIISLAHSLRLKVIAEGVDDEEQAKILRLLRCDEMQGYLFSKPVPFDAMTALLKQGQKA